MKDHEKDLNNTLNRFYDADCCSPGALQSNFDLCIPRKGTARPQSQFAHSCVCERFIYFHDRPTYFPAADRSWEYTNCSQIHECRTGNEAAQFNILEYFFEFSVQCVCSVQWSWLNFQSFQAHRNYHIPTRFWLSRLLSLADRFIPCFCEVAYSVLHMLLL
jgi:hypothetical protein